MEITKELLPKSRVKIAVKLSSPEMRHYFSRVYNKLAPQVEVKGFRKGSAPKAMIIETIGENRIQSEIVDTALQESYPEILKKENLVPVSSPNINVTMMKDLTVDSAEMAYEAEVDIFPQITVGDYKKIHIKPKTQKLEAPKEEIEQVLSHLARQQAEFKEITRPIKDGDRVEMNFEAFDKFVKLEGLSSQNYPVILGSKVLIPEFEKNLIGLKKGDKKEFNIQLAPTPQDKKKDIDFKVEILQTQEVILPELNNDFAKKYQKGTISELKKAIAEDIVKQKIEVGKRDVENAVLEELLKITKVELPESLVHQEVDRELENLRTRLATMSLTYEKYLEGLKKTDEELHEAFEPQAEKTITIGLALGEIVKKENIDTKDKEAGKIALEKLIGYATK